MDQFEIIYWIWAGIIVLMMGSDYYLLHILKKYENELWMSYDKPNWINNSYRLAWDVLLGKHTQGRSAEFTQACKLLRYTIFLFLFSAIYIFGIWPMTWKTA